MKDGRSSAAHAKSAPRRWGRAQKDGILDPYKRPGKLSEPSACSQCGAVYHRGRWQWGALPSGAASVTCQACQRIKDGYPAGTVTLSGSYVPQHRDELVRIARNQEQAEKPEHPLNRIMAIEDNSDRLVISTTDIHLPRRIGEAVARAHHGALDEHFDADGYSARIDWHRDI